MKPISSFGNVTARYISALNCIVEGDDNSAIAVDAPLASFLCRFELKNGIWERIICKEGHRDIITCLIRLGIDSKWMCSVAWNGDIRVWLHRDRTTVELIAQCHLCHGHVMHCEYDEKRRRLLVTHEQIGVSLVQLSELNNGEEFELREEKFVENHSVMLAFFDVDRHSHILALTECVSRDQSHLVTSSLVSIRVDSDMTMEDSQRNECDTLELGEPQVCRVSSVSSASDTLCFVRARTVFFYRKNEPIKCVTVEGTGVVRAFVAIDRRSCLVPGDGGVIRCVRDNGEHIVAWKCEELRGAVIHHLRVSTDPCVLVCITSEALHAITLSEPVTRLTPSTRVERVSTMDSFSSVSCCGVDIYGDKVLFGALGGELCVWRRSLTHVTPLVHCRCDGFMIRCVRFLSCGEFALIGTLEGVTFKWALNSNELTTIFSMDSSITSICMRPQSNEVAIASSSGDVVLLDARNGERRASLLAHERDLGEQNEKFGSLIHYAEVWCVTFDDEGRLLCTSSEDQTICIRDADTFDILHTLRGHTAAVTSISFAGENRLVSCADDRTLRVWSLEDGEQISTFHAKLDKNDAEWHTLTYLAVRNEKVAAVSQNGFLYVFCLQSGELLDVINAATGSIEGCAWSSEGILALCSSDCTVTCFEE